MAGHRVCDPEARARGPPWFREVPATRAPWETPGGAQGEPAAEGAGAVRPELGTWQEAPTMLHKWQLLWLTSRAHGLSHLAQGTGTGQSALHSGFGLEQRAVTPPPGEGRLKASHGVTLASTCWASRGGCGGLLWLGGRALCPRRGLAQQGPQEPRVVAGRSRSAPWETPWVPVKGREPALQSHPRQLVRSSTAAARAPVLPRAPGPWGPTPGPGGRGKPQPSHPELGLGQPLTRQLPGGGGAIPAPAQLWNLMTLEAEGGGSCAPGPPDAPQPSTPVRAGLPALTPTHSTETKAHPRGGLQRSN